MLLFFLKNPCLRVRLYFRVSFGCDPLCATRIGGHLLREQEQGDLTAGTSCVAFTTVFPSLGPLCSDEAQ